MKTDNFLYGKLIVAYDEPVDPPIRTLRFNCGKHVMILEKRVDCRTIDVQMSLPGVSTNNIVATKKELAVYLDLLNRFYDSLED